MASEHASACGRGRRHVLRIMGGGIAAALAKRSARAAPAARDNPPITGDGDPKLAAYDDMMLSFMREHNPPGASLAVSRNGRLVYARGFGYADRERKEPVQPTSLFRIASLSKPFTSTAVLQLIQQGKLRFDSKVFSLLKLQPFLTGSRVDQRIYDVTVQQCLQHTAGWDRAKGFDPMGAEAAEQISRAMHVPLPIRPEHIIRYTIGRPLDWSPGAQFAYSNFGYCVLGRVIEAASGLRYHDYVAQHVLAPIGITRMRLGRNLLADRAPGEVTYYDGQHRTGRAISGPSIGREVPLPYGVECIETMDANGGWVASAIMLVRFVDAFNDIGRSRLLGEQSIRAMMARPPGASALENGKPAPTYYGCGWSVRPADEARGRYTRWHGGLLAGSSTFMLGRADGTNWAIVFNSEADASGKEFAGITDRLLHQVANQIRSWPEDDAYRKYAL